MKRFISCMIIWSCCLQVNAQISDLVVTYHPKLTVNRDSTTYKNPKSRQIIDLIFKKTEEIQAVLKYQDSVVVFEPVKTQQKNQMHDFLYRNAVRTLQLQERYLSDLRNETSCYKSTGLGETFYVRTDPYIWTLHDESDEISGFPCKKATTSFSYNTRSDELVEIDVVAWYTPELPIGIGPKNFHGLPGVILKIEEYEGKIVLEAQEVNVNTKKFRKLNLPDLSKSISSDEHRALIQKAFGPLKQALKNKNK